MNELDVAVCSRDELADLLRGMTMRRAARWIARINAVRGDIRATIWYNHRHELKGWQLGKRRAE